MHPVGFDPGCIARNLHDIASDGFGGHESADEAESVSHPKATISADLPSLTTVVRKIRISERLAGFVNDLARRKLEEGRMSGELREVAIPRRNDPGADFPEDISGFSPSAAVELSRYRESSRRHAGP